jgi:DNA-binding CsgD family transcriptional regulator
MAAQLSDVEFSSIVGEIYDCALNADRWPAVIQRINDAMNGAYTIISLSDPKVLKPRLAAQTPWDADMLARLYDTYRVEGVPGMKEMLESDVDLARSTLDQMPEAAFQASPFFRDWVQPQGLRDACMVKFVQSDERFGMISTATSARRDIVSVDERKLLSMLSPHIRRAAMISDLLDFQRIETQQFQNALDRLMTPVFLVGENAALVYANPQGEALLASRTYVTINSGHLLPTLSSITRPLLDAISRTAGNDLGNRGIGLPLSIAPREAAAAYVLPLSAAPGRPTQGAATAAVFIATARSAQPAYTALLATLYSLTPSEVRVVTTIYDVSTVTAAASVLQISENTVKTHLSHAFSKMGVKRKSELVSVLRGLKGP